MAERIDGKKIAKEINDTVKEKTAAFQSKVGRPPRLVSLTVGEGHDAVIYVNMQKKAAELVGIEFCPRELAPDISMERIATEIAALNEDPEVTAVIVQKPLPEGINHDQVLALISPEKDAEGIHPMNLGKILRREALIVPCTPGAVMKILRVNGVDFYGKEVVIIGHSAIVGKPLSLMMLNEMATTTVCHIGTYEKGDLKSHARKADILVVAVGKAELVKGDWIKPGAVVVDVGINRVDGKVVGDVEFSEAEKEASAITPVPGGVGPVTVSILMRNVYRAYKAQNAALSNGG
ncbi:MAG: bifunctional 5,10-methylenetetrahydrofolate dehydrogenase/5,10-methenyltetrahydrofolate cyclohydrolase [Candidatus Tantalella remota]|nr:bifunctional 5,10-methylenetetrahydrofolate dehydrogenase/5,10-methenyltetrahydrofolate cyclohydrolase [Candidatus Tantalella remota]